MVTAGWLLPDGVTASISGAEGRRQFNQMTRGMIHREGDTGFLPVGIIEVDRRRRRVLVELPAEADSGANRMWVELDDLQTEATRVTEAAA